MERNVQKNGLVNLVAAVVIFIAAFVVTSYVNSLAGQGCSIFLGLGVLVAFASWFQMRLEENERLEKLEVEELARPRGDSTLFESKDAEVFPARRAREQFEKFFVPGFSVLLFLLEAGGAWLLWRWIAKTTNGIAPDRAMPSLVALRHFRAAAVSAGTVFRDHCAAGKPPAVATGRELSAGGRVYLLRHGTLLKQMVSLLKFLRSIRRIGHRRIPRPRGLSTRSGPTASDRETATDAAKLYPPR